MEEREELAKNVGLVTFEGKLAILPPGTAGYEVLMSHRVTQPDPTQYACYRCSRVHCRLTAAVDVLYSASNLCRAFALS